MPTESQLKFIARVIAKVNKLGVVTKKSDLRNTIQDYTLVPNNWLVIAINMPYDDSPQMVSIVSRLPGAWPSKALTITQFERLEERELLALAENIKQQQDAIKALNAKVKQMKADVIACATAGIKRL